VCFHSASRPEVCFLASPEIPTDELSRTVGGFTRLALRFHLVTPSNFQELADSLL
jgi:hypothetical protein